MTLFEELLELLSHDVIVETSQETGTLFHLFVKKYPITKWGRIDWDAICEKYSVASVNDAVRIIDSKLSNSLNQKVNLLWNYSDVPSIQVSLNQVIEYIDDVTAVGADTWVIGPEFSFVIEFFHEGEITLGFASSF